MKQVVIQGQIASFHDEAARQFFGKDIKIVPAETFKEVFDKIPGSHAGVVAIENSLFGSINEVYDLLLGRKFWVVGEVYLRIAQCLIGLPGAKLADITEVHSHPVALAQCEQYLDERLPNAGRFEHHDTAASVADIKKWSDKTKAAIASASAADLHGMTVLAEEIETNQQNYTRFVVVQKQKTVNPNANKTSLVLTVKADTKPGTLYKALGALAKRNINLTMLQSRPVVGKAWHYLFYLDVSVGSEDKAFLAALAELKELGYHIDILGSYQSGL